MKGTSKCSKGPQNTPKTPPKDPKRPEKDPKRTQLDIKHVGLWSCWNLKFLDSGAFNLYFRHISSPILPVDHQHHEDDQH